MGNSGYEQSSEPPITVYPHGRGELFNEQLPITFDAFESYRPYVDTLVEWIANERTAAVLAMDQRMQLEIAEARLVT
ncbi:hypothetical protein [Celerinatantimonas yamalensis]|uniref:Uncharacterized protein n=1 Tax=Celerinatantimonas yamalensis TaxID=559956 RepID=A0ABW9GBS8_9GAMM